MSMDTGKVYARIDDPSTSWEAALSVDVKDSQAWVRTLASHTFAVTGFTDVELLEVAEDLGYVGSASRLRTARIELERRGEIARSDEKRRIGRTHHMVFRYVH
jgi:hypothetical protein